MARDLLTPDSGYALATGRAGERMHSRHPATCVSCRSTLECPLLLSLKWLACLII